MAGGSCPSAVALLSGGLPSPALPRGSPEDTPEDFQIPLGACCALTNPRSTFPESQYCVDSSPRDYGHAWGRIALSCDPGNALLESLNAQRAPRSVLSIDESA